MNNKKITGRADGPNGRNEHYKHNGKEFSRKEMVRKVGNGNMPGYHSVKIGGRDYVRGNPDHSKRDNVDYPREK